MSSSDIYGTSVLGKTNNLGTQQWLGRRVKEKLAKGVMKKRHVILAESNENEIPKRNG